MGTWSLPKTVDRAEILRDAMSRPIPARTACDVLYHVLGDDNLFDNLEHGSDVDPTADARGIVVSTLNDMFFTGSDPASFASPAAVAVVREIVDGFEASSDDLYLKIASLNDEDAARALFGEVLDLDADALGAWTVGRDGYGLDFLASDPEGDRAYRIVAAGGFVTQFCAENMPMEMKRPSPSH